MPEPNEAEHYPVLQMLGPLFMGPPPRSQTQKGHSRARLGGRGLTSDPSPCQVQLGSPRSCSRSRGLA
eukprot:15471616-Alexandrium_andersonii.AAC.1